MCTCLYTMFIHTVLFRNIYHIYLMRIYMCINSIWLCHSYTRTYTLFNHTYFLIHTHTHSTLRRSPFPARRSEELRSQEENEKLLRSYDHMLASGEVGYGGDGEVGYTISESDRSPLVTIESDEEEEEEAGDGRSVVPLSLPFRGFNRPTTAATTRTANDRDSTYLSTSTDSTDLTYTTPTTASSSLEELSMNPTLVNIADNNNNNSNDRGRSNKRGNNSSSKSNIPLSYSRRTSLRDYFNQLSSSSSHYTNTGTNSSADRTGDGSDDASDLNTPNPRDISAKSGTINDKRKKP